ncbi:MAG: oligosaccharide flippase family protein [Planctomycetota bacterium]|jgi:O-antigen/teichoic acid export membrane protein
MIKACSKRIRRLSQLKKNVASGAVLSIFDSLAGLIALPLYMKYLGAEKYGLWATVSVVLTFCRLGQFGIDTAMTKYVAGEYGRKNLRAITEYISTSFYILMIPSLIILGMLGLFSSHIARFLLADDVPVGNVGRLIFFVGLLSVLGLFVNAMRGVVAGIGRMDIANYVSAIGRLSQVALAVILLVLGYGIWSLYFGFLLSYALPLAIWVFMLKHTYGLCLFEPLAFRRKKLAELLKYGGGLTTASVTNMLVLPFNKLVIARYVGLSEVAYYQLANRVVTSLRGLFVQGLQALLPRISEIKGDGNPESFGRIASIHRKGIRFVLLCACPLFGLIFVFAHPLLRTWLGSGFDEQIAVATRILLVGWLANILASPDYFTFLGIGKVRHIVSATWLKSAVNVIPILLILFLGVELTLSTVVAITSVGLIAASILLKYNYFVYTRSNKVKPSAKCLA